VSVLPASTPIIICILSLIEVYIVPQQILDLFPIEELSPTRLNVANGEESHTERLKRIQGNLIWHKPVPVQNEDEEKSGVNRPGSFYRHYRSVDDLPIKATVFFEKAGMYASPPLGIWI
jgi:hypothetical protein